MWGRQGFGGRGGGGYQYFSNLYPKCDLHSEFQLKWFNLSKLIFKKVFSFMQGICLATLTLSKSFFKNYNYNRKNGINYIFYHMG